MNHGLFLNFNFPKRNRGGPPHAAQGDPPVRPGGAPPSPPLKRNIQLPYFSIRITIKKANTLNNIKNTSIPKLIAEYFIDFFVFKFSSLNTSFVISSLQS